MRNLYWKLRDNIQKISFAEIWQGFSPTEFAIYDDTNVYYENHVFPVNKRFCGNTSIDYDGQQLAIWHLTSPKNVDVDILTANIVHEMFHAFQKSNGESRFPDDLALLNYPDTIENHELRFAENSQLAYAYHVKDNSEKEKALTQFFLLRAYRLKKTMATAVHELYVETIEGMAEYAGSNALKQLSTEKYNRRTDEYLQILNSMEHPFFDIRRMYYYSGTILCLTLRKLGISFFHDVGTEKRSIFSLAARNIQQTNIHLPARNPKLLQAFKTYRLEKENIFLTLKKRKLLTVSGEYTICGYDPMNMIRHGNELICKRFVMLREAQHETPLFIEGPVLLFLKDNSNHEVQKYSVLASKEADYTNTTFQI